MKKLRDGAIALVILVVVLQFAVTAMQPYFAWIGRTAAVVICVLLVLGATVGVVASIRYVRNKSDRDDIFND